MNQSAGFRGARAAVKVGARSEVLSCNDPMRNQVSRPIVSGTVEKAGGSVTPLPPREVLSAAKSDDGQA